MKLNPFKKNTDKKEKTGIFKEVKAQAGKKIAEIEKVSDPAERVAQYEDLNKSLQEFYNDGKPDVTEDYDDLGHLTFFGTGLGSMGAVIGTAFAIGVPYIAIPVGVVGCIAAFAGSFTLGEVVGGRRKRRVVSAEYGSVRNAKKMYKLQQAVEKKAEKDKASIISSERKAAWGEKLDKVFNSRAEPEALAAAGTASPGPIQKRLTI